MKQQYVKDWRLLPGSFRIVLTRAVEGNSIREMIRKDEINSKQDLSK